MDAKLDFADDMQPVAETYAELPPGLRAAAKVAIDLRLVRADATWQASSFDLAQGLDVKVMQSKLSPETLDRLFRA